MKKKYEHDNKNTKKNVVSEPAMEYKTKAKSYDIPEEYLLQRIAQAEKDIEEGRITPLSEIKKKPIP